MRLARLLACCLSFFFLISSIISNVNAVIISEIMYNVPGVDDNHEWIEVYQEMDKCENLSEWKFFEQGVNHNLKLINGTDLLCLGDYAIIAEDSGTFLIDYNFIGNLFDSSFSLSNSGENISIKNSSLDVVDYVFYNDYWGADGNNKSLELVENSSLWKESSLEGGTPGIKNSVSFHDIMILNINYSPEDPDVNIKVNVSCELFNAGNYNETDLNLSYFADGSLGYEVINLSVNETKIITFSRNFGLGEHNFTATLDFSDFNISNNNFTKVIDVRHRFVINEVMYNPPSEIGSDADLEWLEIYNSASYGINLSDYMISCDNKTKKLQGFLEQKSFLIVAKDITEFESYYGSNNNVIGGAGWALNNDNDEIELILNFSNKTYSQKLYYSSSWGGDGTGYTLEKKIPVNGDLASNWAESIRYSGSPGQANNPDTKIKILEKETKTSSSGSRRYKSNDMLIVSNNLDSSMNNLDSFIDNLNSSVDTNLSKENKDSFEILSFYTLAKNLHPDKEINLYSRISNLINNTQELGIVLLSNNLEVRENISFDALETKKFRFPIKLPEKQTESYVLKVESNGIVKMSELEINITEFIDMNERSDENLITGKVFESEKVNLDFVFYLFLITVVVIIVLLIMSLRRD